MGRSGGMLVRLRATRSARRAITAELRLGRTARMPADRRAAARCLRPAIGRREEPNGRVAAVARVAPLAGHLRAANRRRRMRRSGPIAEELLERVLREIRDRRGVSRAPRAAGPLARLPGPRGLYRRRYRDEHVRLAELATELGCAESAARGEPHTAAASAPIARGLTARAGDGGVLPVVAVRPAGAADLGARVAKRS